MGRIDLARRAAVAVMEAALGQLWAALLLAAGVPGAWPVAVPPLPLLVAAFAGGAVVQRLRERPGPRDAGWSAAGGAIAAAGVALAAAAAWAYAHGRGGPLPGALALFSAGGGAAYAWWQGALWTVRAPGGGALSELFPRRAAGLLLLVLLAEWAVGAAAAPGELRAAAYRLVVTFFAAGLGALALDRLVQVGAAQRALGQPDAGRGRMAVALAGVTLTLVTLALLADHAGLGTWVQAWLSAAWRGLGVLLGAVGQALVTVLGPVLLVALRPLASLVAWLRSRMRPLPAREPVAAGGGEAADAGSELAGLSRALPPYLGLVAMLLALALVAWLVARLRARPGTAAAPGAVDEERESLGVWRNLGQDLLLTLRWWWSWLTRRRAAPGRDGMSAGAGDLAGAPAAVRDLRTAFRRLQAAGARAGRPRRAPETPLAYGDRLAEAFPAAGGAPRELAGLYARARYGPPGSTGEADVAAARRLLAEVEAAAGERAPG